MYIVAFNGHYVGASSGVKGWRMIDALSGRSAIEMLKESMKDFIFWEIHAGELVS